MRPVSPPGPPRALARTPWQRVPFAALDFETTGLDPARHEVVSFGVVPVERGRVVLAGARYREVRPRGPVRPVSVTIHQLRPVDLAEAPAIEDVRAELAAAIAGRFLLAWSGAVEAGFLAAVFGGSARRWERRIVDVLGLARFLDAVGGVAPPVGANTLTAAARRLGVPVERPHHALDDALTTAQVFLVVMARLEGVGVVTPRRLRRAAHRGLAATATR
ncbi:MAG TPA: 3'-5' exonuclease [Actinomycetota bacterium]|nr:3'-5' exonuclease [Actinomycetota bacterium]